MQKQNQSNEPRSFLFVLPNILIKKANCAIDLLRFKLRLFDLYLLICVYKTEYQVTLWSILFLF